MTTFNVSSASQLTSALASATGGDVILLADGNYGNVTLTQDFSSYVTIKSANPLGAVMTSLNVSGGTFLRVDGVHVSSTGNGGDGTGVVNIDNGSSHIEFQNSEVNGLKDNVYSGSYGIRVVGTTDVLIKGNNVHDVQDGVVGQNSTRLSIVGNSIDYIGNDTMKYSGVNTILIEDNFGGGHVFPAAGAHLDFIQFHGLASSNITIRGNLFEASTRADIQGIFLDDVIYTNVLIEQNIIQTGMINGIVVSQGSGITVRDNTLINIPGEVVHKATLIFVPSSATVTGNITTSYEGGMKNGNLQMQNVDPTKPYYVDLYFSHVDAGMGQLKLADLKPIAGSLGATLGAADRIAELLSGGGSSSGGSGSGTGGGTTPPPPPPEPDVADLVYAMNGSHDFNGSPYSVVTTAHRDALEIDQGTIAFSFNADTVQGRHGLVSKDAQGYTEGGNHMTISILNGELRALFGDDDSSVRLDFAGIQADTDYDVVATFDNDTVKLFVNGKLVDSEQFHMNWEDNQQTLMIGATGWSSSAYTDKITNVFDGTISDVHIWDEAMTPQELLLLA